MLEQVVVGRIGDGQRGAEAGGLAVGVSARLGYRCHAGRSGGGGDNMGRVRLGKLATKKWPAKTTLVKERLVPTILGPWSESAKL